MKNDNIKKDTEILKGKILEMYEVVCSASNESMNFAYELLKDSIESVGLAQNLSINDIADVVRKTDDSEAYQGVKNELLDVVTKATIVSMQIMLNKLHIVETETTSDPSVTTCSIAISNEFMDKLLSILHGSMNSNKNE